MSERLFFSVLVAAAVGYLLGGFVSWQVIYRDDVERLQDRVLQLEVHDCGLRQFEDYSVTSQADDATRFRCVLAMREGR